MSRWMERSLGRAQLSPSLVLLAALIALGVVGYRNRVSIIRSVEITLLCVASALILAGLFMVARTIYRWNRSQAARSGAIVLNPELAGIGAGASPEPESELAVPEPEPTPERNRSRPAAEPEPVRDTEPHVGVPDSGTVMFEPEPDAREWWNGGGRGAEPRISDGGRVPGWVEDAYRAAHAGSG